MEIHVCYVLHRIACSWSNCCERLMQVEKNLLMISNSRGITMLNWAKAASAVKLPIHMILVIIKGNIAKSAQQQLLVCLVI